MGGAIAPPGYATACFVGILVFCVISEKVSKFDHALASIFYKLQKLLLVILFT